MYKFEDPEIEVFLFTKYDFVTMSGGEGGGEGGGNDDDGDVDWMN